MTETLPSQARGIVAGMRPWFSDIEKNMAVKKRSSDGRTPAECTFDNGVFAASELVRRLTGNEQLALAVHEACIWRQRQLEAESRKPKEPQ